MELWGENLVADVTSKKIARSEREMATPLSLLPSVEPGISILDLLTMRSVPKFV